MDVDQGQMRQVLLNIYVNAWQAMPEGGDLYIKTENRILDEYDVKPFSAEPGRYVKLSLTDTGVGMDKATQKRIFEPFFTTKETGGGTGLGLASAYRIIENHDGFIRVSSEKGHGTCFEIYLPASERILSEEEKSAGQAIKGSETVLLIDDEEMITEVTETLLQKMGYRVVTAKSGEVAIKIYEAHQNQIDIVILDMVMPDMSGGSTYDRLKALNPEAKDILSNGYSIDGQASEILNRGCDGFIQKPYKMREISQKMRAILDKDKLVAA